MSIDIRVSFSVSVDFDFRAHRFPRSSIAVFYRVASVHLEAPISFTVHKAIFLYNLYPLSGPRDILIVLDIYYVRWVQILVI